MAKTVVPTRQMQIEEHELVGVVKMWAGNTAPDNYMLCNGQSVAVADFPDLYAVIGNSYGGNSTFFNLPDFRGRVAIGAGQGTGLTAKSIGEAGGAESVILTEGQLPAHKHQLNGLDGGTDSNTPLGNFLPQYANTAVKFYAQQSAGENLLQFNADSIGNTGSNQGHPNMQPYLGVNYIICVAGLA